MSPEGAYPREEVVKPQGTEGGPSSSPARNGESPHGDNDSGLMERVVERNNMLAALKRVERNGGAPGIDGIPTERLRDQIRAEWPRIRQELLSGTYKPKPVRRVEIPKPGGGKRLLGIPTVMDRLIQQHPPTVGTRLQVLTPIFDVGFSEHSYGFRPRKRAHDAIREARRYVQEGYEWVVDLDIEKFFDRVNHDILMARVARKVKDKRVLTLIRRYLQAGVMINGVVMETTEGTPQGGPISPLLANILLDELDKELEKRGHKFVRYADDCNIYVKSKRAGERVMESIKRYLQERLKLKINEQKSAVDRPWKLKFLGFSMHKAKGGQILIRLAPQTIERVKTKIRDITARNKPVSIAERIGRLNTYLGVWMGYFALAETPSVFKDLDGWIRRRLRMCLWKQWKRVRTRYRELRALGLPERVVHEFANARKGPWRMAHGPMNRALGNAYWQSQGLTSLIERYQRLREAW